MFVWLENNELKITFQKELATENAIEIDTLGIIPIPSVEAFVKIENGQIIKKNQDEILQWFKDEKLKMLKFYVSNLLSNTDYIVVKISEAQVFGDTVEVENLKQKYSTQLQEREAIREWNEQMKQNIKNANTLDVINNIEIKFNI